MRVEGWQLAVGVSTAGEPAGLPDKGLPQAYAAQRRRHWVYLHSAKPVVRRAL